MGTPRIGVEIGRGALKKRGEVLSGRKGVEGRGREWKGRGGKGEERRGREGKGEGKGRW